MNIKYIKTTDNKKYDLRDKRITDTDTGIATQSANGLLSSGDKKKLDGIASGAEVNQNAFSNIKIGNTTISADGKTDTVELTAGNNITLTPDATNDKITIAATNTNTTYTFKGGTNQFTVTPSNGTEQTVSVTPSIANNVTGSDLTANTIILGNGNSGVKKSGKTIVTTLGSDDTTLPTSKAVKAAIDALPEPMIFKGTLGKDGTITSLPAAAASNEGYTYKVITDGEYAQQSAKIGDVFISNGSSWNLIPSGNEPSGTVTNVATGTGLTGGPITSSGTISHADTSSQASVSNSGRTYIQSITLDGMGHVTGIASATETVTNTDTKVTQRLFTRDGLMPLLFATEQSGYQGDITNIVYRNDAIYASPSQGYIYANRFVGTFDGTLYGSAYEAHQLERTTSVGSETQPVYFKQGVPTACSYQLNKTVPSNAVFTDTDTKVTSAANHYTPAEDTSSQLDADASSTTAATWNSTSLVTGVTIKRDAKGHVVGLGVDSIKMPGNPNTDNKVCQTLTSANINLPLLMSYNSNTITADTFNLVYRNNSIYANPAEGTITAKLKGNIYGQFLRQANVETVSAARYVYVKLGTFDYNSFGTLCVHLEGGSIKDELYINYGSGNAYSPVVCGWYASNAGNVKEIDLVYGTSWNGDCELWLNVYQSSTLNIAVLRAIRGDGFTVNTATNWSATTTSPTFNKKVPLIRGMFGDLSGDLSGNASSASKLTTNAGSATQPVYFSGGVPTAISYTIDKSVPSSNSDDSTVPTSKAVWTAVSNGIAAADAMIYRGTIAGGSTGAYGALTPFANNGWTYKVTTAGKIDGKAVEIGDMLICNKDGTTAATSSDYSTIAANWDVIQANIDGAVTGPESSTDAHVAVFNGATGKVIKDSGFTIAKSVPSNAVFTDTHYTTHLYAGNGTAANAETANGNTKLTVVDNTTTRNSVTIKGTGGTTVTSDANGVVTIDSVNKNSKWFNFYSPGKVDNAYYFIISPIGGSKVTPSGTCYSIEINAVVQSSPGNYIVSNTKFVTWCYWYDSNAGLRITYPVYSNSKIPIYYHNKAEGYGIGNETRSSNVCNIPIKVENVESLSAVNIKVEGPGVSDCICNRSYSSFNWGQDEPTSWSSI